MIANGWVTIFTVTVDRHVPSVYDITDVPTVTPLTIPVLPTVATAVLELVQTPPPVASVNGDVVPWQIVVDPPIAAGWVFTVTVVVDTQLPIV